MAKPDEGAQQLIVTISYLTLGANDQARLIRIDGGEGRQRTEKDRNTLKKVTDHGSAF